MGGAKRKVHVFLHFTCTFSRIQNSFRSRARFDSSTHDTWFFDRLGEGNSAEKQRDEARKAGKADSLPLLPLDRVTIIFDKNAFRFDVWGCGLKED